MIKRTLREVQELNDVDPMTIDPQDDLICSGCGRGAKMPHYIELENVYVCRECFLDMGADYCYYCYELTMADKVTINGIEYTLCGDDCKNAMVREWLKCSRCGTYTPCDDCKIPGDEYYQLCDGCS